MGKLGLSPKKCDGETPWVGKKTKKLNQIAKLNHTKLKKKPNNY